MNQTRNTQQRRLIISILENNPTHPTADEIYEIARQREPRISRGTVYRNLNLLSDRGQVYRMAMPDGPDHYDYAIENHYHFFCRKCLRVADAALPYNATLNQTSLQGYHTEWHRLLLVGLCPECSS